MSPTPEELLQTRSSAVLVKAQLELREALNGLGGKTISGLLDSYRGHTAQLINRAAEAFIYLRDGGRVDASKLLVRPAIEAAFRLQAVNKDPEMLFRIATSEFEEDKKWLRTAAAAAKQDPAEALAQLQTDWDDFKRHYGTAHPCQILKKSKVSTYELAQKAEIEGYYDAYYRFYSQFTHAAFRSSTGDLDDFEHHDSRVMAFCTLIALNAANLIGAPTPNLEALWDQLTVAGKP